MDYQLDINSLREIEESKKYGDVVDAKDLQDLPYQKNGKVLFKRSITRRRSIDSMQGMLFNV